MKKSLVIGMILLIVMVLSVTSIAGAKSAATPSKGMFVNSNTMEISWTGYCDGITATLNPTNGIVTGMWSNSCVACPYPNDIGAGTLGVIRNQGLGATMAWQTEYGTAPFFFLVVRSNHTAVLYNFDGSVLNTTAWAECVAGAQNTGKTAFGSR